MRYRMIGGEACIRLCGRFHAMHGMTGMLMFIRGDDGCRCLMDWDCPSLLRRRATHLHRGSESLNGNRKGQQPEQEDFYARSHGP